MLLMIFLFVSLPVLFVLRMFIARYPTYARSMYIVLILLTVCGYLYLTSPACDKYGSVAELEKTSGMAIEDFLTTQSETVGNILFNSPSWYTEGEAVYSCWPRIREMVPLH